MHFVLGKKINKCGTTSLFLSYSRLNSLKVVCLTGLNHFTLNVPRLSTFSFLMMSVLVSYQFILVVNCHLLVSLGPKNKKQPEFQAE